MAMEITNSYSSYAAQNMAGNNAANSTKKKEAENTSKAAGSSKSKSTSDYVNELAKLVPSVELKVGNSFSTAQSGKTLTIHPQLLEKMKNDPEQEKETKELIQGVESAVRLIDSINHASGWTVVFKHDYIDENGKYRQIALVRNDFMLNMSDKLREERKENSEKLIEKTKEKAAEKKEELENSRVKETLDEKAAASKDGEMYLNETDFEELMEAAKEDQAGNFHGKEKIVLSPKEDQAVKVSISEEGIKMLHESGIYGANGKIFIKEKESIIKQAKQETNALLLHRYGDESDKETEKLKEQRAEIKEMITGEFQRLSAKAGSKPKGYI